MNPSAATSLRERARSATAEELDSIPWLQVLDEADRRHVAGAIVVATAGGEEQRRGGDRRKCADFQNS